MLDYEGEVTNPSRHTHYPQDMGDEDFYAASVTLADHDATLDTVADTAFAPELAGNEKYDNDSMFLEKLKIRAEISKMMGSLGSVQTSYKKRALHDPYHRSHG